MTTTIQKLPTTIEEFETLRNQLSTSPEGGATAFMVALKIFTSDQQLGHQCFVLTVDRNNLSQGNVYKGFQLNNSDISRLKSQIKYNPKLADSYIKGGLPENNYSINQPYVYEYSTNPTSGSEADGYMKLFIKCYGADSPRPIHVKKNNRGVWKVSNWSSVIVGIKKPPIDDDI